MNRRILSGALVALLVATLTASLPASPAAAENVDVANPGLIQIPGPGQITGAATPYPSEISFLGVTGRIIDVGIFIPRLLHGSVADLDIMLVSPSNKGVVLMSDVGGDTDFDGALALADGPALVGATPGPPPTPLVQGFYLPTDNDDATDERDNYPPPPGDARPPPTMGSSMSHFNGDDPNGTWELRVVDDKPADDVGAMPQGWTLRIETDDAAPPPPPPPGGGPCEGVPDAGFTDVGPDNVHKANIDCLVAFGVTVGTTPTTFNPQGTVTRSQMASFVARAIEATDNPLPANPPNAFDDDAGNVHEPRINQLAAAGVIGGNGELGRSYLPQTGMRRDHMASFMFEADQFIFGAPLEPGPDAFTDDNGNPHEVAINALAADGVIAGRGGGIFDPGGTVTRAQMASFLARLLGLWAELGLPPMRP